MEKAQGTFPPAVICSSLPDLLQLFPGSHCKPVHATSSDRMKVISLFLGQFFDLLQSNDPHHNTAKEAASMWEAVNEGAKAEAD